MKAYVMEISGIRPAMEAMRLSFGSESKVLDKVESLGYSVQADDLALLKKLVLAGESHSKVIRMIQVHLDLTLPRYMWAEFDQYRIGTTSMSESTVHTLQKDMKSGDFGINNFECTDKTQYVLENMLCEVAASYSEDDLTVEELKQLLPESFLQRRIVNLNYQTLRHMYFDRRNHRMKIWHTFLDEVLKQLPFPELITVEA